MSTDATVERVRRRTVLKGAAWSVPVLAAAVAVPAHAASACPECEGFEVHQEFTHQPGAWQYRDTVTITHCGEPFSLAGVTVIVDFSDPSDYTHGTNGDGTSTEYDSETGVLTVVSTTSDESMYFSGQLGHGSEATHLVTGTVSLSVPGCGGLVVDNAPFAFVAVKDNPAA